MSAIRKIFLVCNTPDCEASISCEAATVGQLRAYAATAGWAFRQRSAKVARKGPLSLDYCPHHNPEQEALPS